EGELARPRLAQCNAATHRGRAGEARVDTLEPGNFLPRTASTPSTLCKLCGPAQTSSRTSVSLPVTAAAAAIAGLTRCVRAPGPWRPTKLRLLVEAQRSPAGTLSGFMPRHAEQPGSRHSSPASVKTLSRPSASAC